MWVSGRQVTREEAVVAVLEKLMQVGLELRRGTGGEGLGFHQQGGQNR